MNNGTGSPEQPKLIETTIEQYDQPIDRWRCFVSSKRCSWIQKIIQNEHCQDECSGGCICKMNPETQVLNCWARHDVFCPASVGKSN